jgi:hypothetical protein
MLPSYNLGVKNGLNGFELLQFVANRSGWPGHLGVDWTNKNRPDYTAGLKKAYATDNGEPGGSVADRTPWETPESPYTAIDGSDRIVNTTNAAAIFHAMSNGEHVQTYKEWASDKSTLEKINPLGYILDQGAALGFRAVLILLGAALILLAFVRIAFNAAPAADAGSNSADSEGFVELT